jgi:hypothetical protein
MNRTHRHGCVLLCAALVISAAACGDDDGSAGGGGGGAGGGAGGGSGSGGGAGGGSVVDPDAGTPPPAESCLLVYDLDQNEMKIRDTAGGLGDFDLPEDAEEAPPASFTGKLILRVETSAGAIVDEGQVQVVYYEFNQYFQTDSSGIVTILTDVDAFSPALGADDNAVTLADGTFDHDGAGLHVLSFPDCTLPAGHDDDEDAYTPDVVGTGSGCLAPAFSVGNVDCMASDFLCGQGNLEMGSNAQDEEWEQKLHDVEIANDFSTLDFADMDDDVIARHMQVPNRSPARTYVRWHGTLDAAASSCDD